MLMLILILLYLTQVNYLHSHGLAHTELRLENVHISPVDRHIKVSILISQATPIVCIHISLLLQMLKSQL